MALVASVFGIRFVGGKYPFLSMFGRVGVGVAVGQGWRMLSVVGLELWRRFPAGPHRFPNLPHVTLWFISVCLNAHFLAMHIVFVGVGVIGGRERLRCLLVEYEMSCDDAQISEIDE